MTIPHRAAVEGLLHKTPTALLLVWALVSGLTACHSDSATTAPAEGPGTQQQATLGGRTVQFNDYLPRIEGRTIHGQDGSFSLELPAGWRVAPIPAEVNAARQAAGFEEILLRPVLDLKATPRIRISRAKGLRMDLAALAKDPADSAVRILGRFIPAHGAPSLADAPRVINTPPSIAFVFLDHPGDREEHHALIRFGTNDTYLFIGSYEIGSTREDHAAFAAAMRAFVINH